MNKKTLLILLLVAGFTIAACTPQQQQEAADAMMEDDSAMMEDGDAMKDDSMMEDDSAMMEEGDSMMEEGDSMMEEGEHMGVVEVDVSGVNFAFDKKEIRVKEGDRVKITFTSESGFHDWVVDEFNAATEQVRDGGVTSVEFVADKKGTFEYYCSVGSHRALGMVGNLIVE